MNFCLDLDLEGCHEFKLDGCSWGLTHFVPISLVLSQVRLPTLTGLTGCGQVV